MSGEGEKRVMERKREGGREGEKEKEGGRRRERGRGERE